MSPLRRLARELPAARRQAVASAVAGVLTAGCVVGQAVVLAHVVAAVVESDASLAELRTPLALLVVLTCARGALAGAVELTGETAARRAGTTMRTRLLGALLGARPLLLHGARQGDLTAAATTGVDALGPLFSRLLPQLALAVAVPVVVLAAVVPVDATSAVIMAVTVPLVPLFAWLVGAATTARARSRWRALQDLSTHFLDVVRGLATLVAHDRGDAQPAAVRATGERYRRETMGTLRIAFLSALVLELCAMLGTALVAVTVGLRLVHGDLELEAGLAVLLLAPELYQPLRQAAAGFHAGADGAAAAETILGAVDGRAEAPPAAWSRRAPHPAGGPIELRDVGLVYPGAAVPALHGLDLVLHPGEHLAVTGASGAGKSSLGLLLLRLVAPTSGTITAAGVDLADVDPDEWRAGLAWVPQRPRLLPTSLGENLRLARPDASDQALRACLHEAGIGSLAGSLEERVGDGGRGLSVGERRRVAIARALLRDAGLVVLDEPTADLDAESAVAVAEAIERLALGRTIVLATHAPGLAARADRTIELAAGRLVGAPDPPERRRGARMRPVTPLRRMLVLARGVRGRLALSVVLGAVAVAAGIGLLATSGYLIARAAERPPVLALTVAIVGVRAFALTRAAARYLERLAGHDAALRILVTARVALLERLLALVTTRLPPAADVLTRAVADVDRLQELFLRALSPPVVALIVTIAASLAAGLLLPAAGFVLLAGLVATGVAVPTLSSVVGRRATRDAAAARGALAVEITETLAAATEVVALGAGARQTAHVAAADGRLAVLVRREAVGAALATALGIAAPWLTVVAMIVVAAPAVDDGSLEPVLLPALLLLGLASFEAVTGLAGAAQGLAASTAAAERLEELAPSAAPVTTPPSRPRGAIHAALEVVVEHLAVRPAPDAPPAVADVSFTLRPGERVALVGRSGSGKSTVLRALVGLLPCDRGTVTVAGTGLDAIDLHALRARIRLLDQEAHLFSTSIAENVRLARPDATDEEVREALARVGLGPWLDTLPGGLHERLGDDGARASGGQRARVALARGLVSRAELLLVDEPTSHLDADAAGALLDDLLALPASTGVLVTTHRPADLLRFDRVLVLEDGRIVQDGDPEALAAVAGPLARMLAAGALLG